MTIRSLSRTQLVHQTKLIVTQLRQIRQTQFEASSALRNGGEKKKRCCPISCTRFHYACGSVVALVAISRARRGERLLSYVARFIVSGALSPPSRNALLDAELKSKRRRETNRVCFFLSFFLRLCFFFVVVPFSPARIAHKTRAPSEGVAGIASTSTRYILARSIHEWEMFGSDFALFIISQTTGGNEEAVCVASASWKFFETNSRLGPSWHFTAKTSHFDKRPVIRTPKSGRSFFLYLVAVCARKEQTAKRA